MRGSSRAGRRARSGAPFTGDEIAAISRFPDQNPNPVMRLGDDGTLMYANPASAPILKSVGMAVGHRPPDDWLATVRGVVDSDGNVEVRCDRQTFEIVAIAIPEFGFVNLYGRDVTADRLVTKFPDLNPNPVMRIDDDGRLRYANPASRGFLDVLGSALGELLPASLREPVFDVLAGRRPGPFETVWESRTFSIVPVRLPELNLINLYASEITAEKAIVKFPDQNPNPVFRTDRDGRLVYANPASRELIAGIGAEVGRPLPEPLRGSILEAAGRQERERVEIASADRLYALLPVDVPEFGFVNVYGTDITAARQIEVLNRENERLLLNVLPPPIAERLRQGEKLIADRFDDVTLLFADIVEFTQLSGRMSASELVTVLNEVFSVFDSLADEYELEKVKTIGDAYMVVGGLPEPLPDHTDRAARMALAMVEQVRAIPAASHLGVRFRIGMHCGPVVAGVIGTRKFIYDMWGDTVNVASRMESHGVPGRIQVTAAVEQRLRERYEFEPRGLVDIKGKGLTPTWFLVRPVDSGARQGTSRASPSRAPVIGSTP